MDKLLKTIEKKQIKTSLNGLLPPGLEGQEFHSTKPNLSAAVHHAQRPVERH